MANQQAALENALLKVRYIIHIWQGETAGAEAYFKERYQLASLACERISCRYYLGLLCEREGRFGEAQNHLAEVAQYGGTTWFARAAQSKLAAGLAGQ